MVGQSHYPVWVAQLKANLWSNKPKGGCTANASWTVCTIEISSPVKGISSSTSWVLLLSWAHPLKRFCTITKAKCWAAAKWLALNKGQLENKEYFVGIEERWTHLDTASGELGRGGKRSSNAILWSEHSLPHGTESFELPPGKFLLTQKHANCTRGFNKLQLLIKLLMVRHLIWALAFRTLFFFAFFPMLDNFKDLISNKPSPGHSCSNTAPLRGGDHKK